MKSAHILNVFPQRKYWILRPSVPIAAAYPSKMVSNSVLDTSAFLKWGCRVGFHSLPERETRMYIWELRNTVFKRKGAIWVDFTVTTSTLWSARESVFATKHMEVIKWFVQLCHMFALFLALLDYGFCLPFTYTVFPGVIPVCRNSASNQLLRVFL